MKRTLLASASILAALSSASVAFAQPAAPQVEEVVVTGSRLQSTGFAAPTPVTAVTTAQIEARAPGTIADALNTLPQIANNGPAKNTFGSTTIGMNQLALRSLGANRTLTLVDGRRYVPSSTTNAFDSNLIPAGLVQRTEVVTGGASAAYGSDAVAGVINIILNDKLVGVHANAQIGRSSRGDDINHLISVSAGSEFADGKGHLIAGAEWGENLGAGRNGEGPYSRDWYKEGGQVALPATRPAGTPANVLGTNAEFSNMTPGGIIIGSTTTAGAASTALKGTAFGPNGVPYAFQYGNLVGNALMLGSTGNYGYLTQARQPIEAAFRRYVGMIHGSYDFNANLSGFLEVNYGYVAGHNNTADPQIGPGGQIFTSGVIIPTALFTATGFTAGQLANPYLPAAQAAQANAAGLRSVTVGRVLPENGGFSTNNTSDTKQITAGLNGNVFGDWKWNAYAEFGNNRYTLDVPNVLRTANVAAAMFSANIGGQIVCGTAALNAVNPNLNAITRTQVTAGCVPINPFGGPMSVTQAQLDYIRNHMFYYINSTQATAAATINGTPFSTWAGPVSLAAGVEARQNTAEADADEAGKTGSNLYGNYQAFKRKEINVKEAFLEVGVPLAKDMFLAKSLDLNAAARRTDYSTSGAVTTWKVGLTYEPVDFLRFRATKSRDIRAPNLGDLYATTGGVTQATNQYTGQTATVPTQAVGNPSLTPEVADTFTAGVVFQPQWAWAGGFRASVDYYKIEIADVIASLPTTLLDAQCFGAANIRQSAAYCGQYYIGYDPSVVDPASPNYKAAVGYSGRRNPGFNLNALKIDGIDVEASYRLPIDKVSLPGRLDARVLATWLDDNDTIAQTFSSTGVFAGNVSQGDSAGTLANPEWKVNMNVNYTLGAFAGNLQLRGFTAGKYSTTLVGPNDPTYNAAATNSINRNILPGIVYADIGASYLIKQEGARRLQVYGNIDNLLDHNPPAYWIQTMGQYDTVGRTYRVGLRFDY